MPRCSVVLLLLGWVGLSAAETPPEFASLKYRFVGPFAGGRVARACGVPGDPLTYYAATASGGVWKSQDGGFTWKPIFDDQPTSSIGSIAVAPTDPNVIYVGSGEANIRGNVAPGAGIFKSEDAGKTWKHVWKQIGQIGTITVHPNNPDICFAAVLGHAFGPNSERGIYRTTDGGKTWNKMLFVNDETGASDVAIDPSNPRVIVAGFWQTRRRPWEHTSGGPGSDLFISRDGGDNWQSLKKEAPKNGLPKGLWGKIGVAFAPSNSQRIYAIIENENGGLFRSEDSGESWSQVNDSRPIRQRAWYFSTLTVHPTNADVVFAPNVPMLKSIDGGKSFRSQRGFHHVDHHDLWIDPKNPNRMIVSNDGGVEISTDGGKNWFAPALPIGQFYHVHADNSVPYRVMGAMQDLGTASGPSRSLSGRISPGDWHGVGGGEAGHVLSDPSDPNIVYAGEYGGIMTRYDHRTKQARNITINQINPSGIDPYKLKYRFNWTSPILVSRHNPKVVYHAANFLFRTTDNGLTWQKVSPDLTRNDKQKQQWSGGPITGDNTGAEIYCTIFALAESPKKKGLIWAGSDDGRVHLTQDDCKTWTEVTANIPDLPDWGTVKTIEASPHDAGTAYLVVDSHKMDDYRPYVWKTTNFGKSWTKITDGVPVSVHCHALREDPKKKGLLYLGTEQGILVSWDAGQRWEPMQLNLPTVPVHDLQVKDDDLVLGTHGRGIWILDDLTVIRNWNPNLKDKPVHLFPVLPAIKWQLGGGGVSSHDRRSSTSDPDYGAIVWFHLGKLPKDKVTIELHDAKGTLVARAIGQAKDEDDDEDDEGPEFKRTFTIEEGGNRFVWDLTHDGAKVIPGAPVDLGSAAQPVPVSPGKYQLTLKVGNTTVKQPVEVQADPRFPPALEPLQQAEQLALQVRDQISELSETVLRIRALQKQLKLRGELLKDQDDAKELLKSSEAFGKKLGTLEEKLHNSKAKISYDIFAQRGGAMLYSQLAWLLGNVSEANGPPTQAQKELAAELGKTLNGYVREFEQLTGDELKKLNEAAAAVQAPALYLTPKRKVTPKVVSQP